MFDFGGHRSTVAGQRRTRRTGFFIEFIKDVDRVDNASLLAVAEVVEDDNLIIV